MADPPLLLAAFDKFRGTLSAHDAGEAACAAARDAGLCSENRPLADGGEGLLEVVGGTPMRTSVTGPLGQPVDAEWRLVDGSVPTAVIEMARASGMGLVNGPAQNDPIRATTRGTGELIAAAIGEGCRRIVVGVGGSATTDGGSGALEAVDPSMLDGVELLVACDVETEFLDAARVFGPQKGASAHDVDVLTARLDNLADQYVARYGVDVRTMARAGAAGGLSGGLAAIGGRLVSGFGLVAALTGFDEAVERAGLVVTGEGRLDATSFAGKVVGNVIEAAAGRSSVVVVVGIAEPGAIPDIDGVRVVVLAERFGIDDARSRTAELVRNVVRAELRAIGW